MGQSSATESATASIAVEGLTKLYGEFRAVNQISFQVQPGEIVGFLGPNGAGKSTTMKILTSFMAPTAGRVKIMGMDVADQAEAVRRRIGYLPENVPLYDEMLVHDYLHFVAELRGVKASDRDAHIQRAARMTGLSHRMGDAIGELSKGYRQRVGLAQAILHDPDVVILDEPTTGLDPNQIIEIRDLIKTIGQHKTVLFSTHIMQEVSAVCDRVIIIHRGTIVADDTVAGLSDKLAATSPGLVLVAAGDDASATREALLKLPGVKAAHIEPGAQGQVRVRLEGELEAIKRAVFAQAAEGKLQVAQLAPHKPTLEEIFRFYTGGETQEGAVSAPAQGGVLDAQPTPGDTSPVSTKAAAEAEEAYQTTAGEDDE